LVAVVVVMELHDEAVTGLDLDPGAFGPPPNDVARRHTPT